MWKLYQPYKPSGDQPKAIKEILKSIERDRFTTLLGATGTGKTYTVAHVIEKINKPTLVIAHNKTLAAQLASEFQTFFPENAVHYFVSYYDYYQPEAYKPITDTYIEKEAMINKEIDRLRHKATQSLLTRDDVLIVASVSAIYGVGSPLNYLQGARKFKKGERLLRQELLRILVHMHYSRVTADLEPASFRATGSFVEVYPPHEEILYRFKISAGRLAEILLLDPITREIKQRVDEIMLFPAKHFVTPDEVIKVALEEIRADLKKRVKELEEEGKTAEASRLQRRVLADVARIEEFGYCNGIENYSRYFDRRSPGEAPDTLLSFFRFNPKTKKFDRDFLTVIDESHVTLPQLSGMYAGDASRKKTLIDYGFRLPAAADNRPLTFDEFIERIEKAIFVSATPGEFEKKNSTVVEQIIRPTGLLDPEVIVSPVVERGNYPGQVKDVIERSKKVIEGGGRVLITTLTKKMAEDLSEFLKERSLKAEYIHSDIKTKERIEILSDFRRGVFDILVGVNLLREGLDLPEVEMVAILDADKEGFLRSETSLIQTMGRAARNVKGHVVLYADEITGSLKRAVDETNRRRKLQKEYNEKHGITPQTVKKEIHDITEQFVSAHKKAVLTLAELDIAGLENKKDIKKLIADKKLAMKEATKELDFETAATLRDEIALLEEWVAKNLK